MSDSGIRVAGDMTKAVYDPDADGRIEKDALEVTLDKLLKGAGAGNNPTEIDVPSGKSIAYGSYVGDNVAGRQITTGFKVSMVVVKENNTNWITVPATHTIRHFNTSAYHATSTYPRQHVSDGFQVGGSLTFANGDGLTYYYWAISE